MPDHSFSRVKYLPAGDPLLVDVHQNRSDQPEEGLLVWECSYNLGPSLELFIDPFYHVGGSDPLPVLFWECHVIHEPEDKPLNGAGRFPVSPSIQVIGEILESLFTPIRLL